MSNLEFLSLATTYQIDKSFDSDRFIKMRLKICHDGVNPNGSSFAVKDIENAESSIGNTPILANTIVDEDDKTVDLGGHDFHLEKHKLKDDDYKIIYDELVVGVVPETSNYEIADSDGRKYAFSDCYIYRGYSNYFEDYIEENQESKLSMEILVDGYNYDSKNNIFNITDYRYKGITFLGKSYGTGMAGAKATVSNFEEKKNLFTMLSELKTEIERYQSSLNNEEVDINTFKEKEDDLNLDEKMKLLEQYGLSLEALGFGIEELSLEDLQSKLDEFATKSDEAVTTKSEEFSEPETLEETTEAPAVKTEEFALNQQFMDELLEKVGTEKIESDWGSYSRYCYVDHDSETTEVYTFDRKDWKLYGFAYSVSGDAVSVDFETKKRKKFSIVDFVDGTAEGGFTFEAATKDIFECKDATYKTLQDEFNIYKEGYSTPNTDVEELKNYKLETLASQRAEAEGELFEQFEEKLNGDAEYEALKADCKSMSLPEISDKCFVILGKKYAKVTTTKKTSAVKVPASNFGNQNDETKPYGDVYDKYLK